MPIDTVEDEPLSLFRSLEVALDGSIAQVAIGSRMYQIDAALLCIQEIKSRIRFGQDFTFSLQQIHSNSNTKNFFSGHTS